MPFYNPKLVVEADRAVKVEYHDCGSGDYAIECWLADGTYLDMCEVFGDGCGPDWTTLKDMSGPVPVDLHYPRWMRKPKTRFERLKRFVHLHGGYRGALKQLFS